MNETALGIWAGLATGSTIMSTAAILLLRNERDALRQALGMSRPTPAPKPPRQQVERLNAQAVTVRDPLPGVVASAFNRKPTDQP